MEDCTFSDITFRAGRDAHALDNLSVTFAWKAFSTCILIRKEKMYAESTLNMSLMKTWNHKPQWKIRWIAAGYRLDDCIESIKACKFRRGVPKGRGYKTRANKAGAESGLTNALKNGRCCQSSHDSIIKVDLFLFKRFIAGFSILHNLGGIIIEVSNCTKQFWIKKVTFVADSIEMVYLLHCFSVIYFSDYYLSFTFRNGSKYI